MNNNQILIADDEKHTRLALHLVLRQAGFEVVLAKNGRDAYEKIQQTVAQGSTISLIITDFKMPELDGLGLIDRLKADNITIPTIVITGYGDNNLALELQDRGCAAYLDKPFIPEEVLNRVETVLQLQVH